MKSAQAFVVVLVTAPDMKVARRLAQAALKEHLVACATLVPKIESHYWWKGKVETAAETLLLLKTKRATLVALEKLIVAKHPYDTPEFLALPLAGGSARYLKWLSGSTD